MIKDSICCSRVWLEMEGLDGNFLLVYASYFNDTKY